MNALIRNTTKSLSRFNGYESLGRFDESDRELLGQRSPSKRNKSDPAQAAVLASFSYRRARAKQRLVFLRTYKLTSASRLKRPESSSQKLKKVVVKLKTAVVKLVSLIRIKGSLRSCNSQSDISTSNPIRVTRCPVTMAKRL